MPEIDLGCLFWKENETARLKGGVKSARHVWEHTKAAAQQGTLSWQTSL